MHDIELWKLSDELSVVHAAMLIASHNPTEYDENVETFPPGGQPVNFHPVFTALTNAINSGKLAANLRFNCRYDDPYYGYHTDEFASTDQNNESVIIKNAPDWKKTTIDVENLKAWLLSRGINSGFFFSDNDSDAPDFLNPNKAFYAPKLAAAVKAWLAVSSDEQLTRGKTVKQALETWLRKNAGQYGFTDDDGNPTKSAVEEISKVANWDTKGGAPKTPSE